MKVSRHKLCNEGPELSRLIMGTWRLLDQPALNSQQTLALIEKCLEHGITTFDQADIYADYTCEAHFGEALKLKPSLRDEIEIITKCGIKLVSENRPKHKVKHYDTSKKHIIASVENSLQQMGKEHIDLLLLHRPDPLLYPDEVAEAFHLLNEQGKVHHFGVSNFTASQYALLQSRCPMPLVTNQLEISLLHRDAMLDGTLDQLIQHKRSPMAWSPLGGGTLFKASDSNAQLHALLDSLQKKYGGATYDQLALAWLYKHPSHIFPVLGTRKAERIARAAEVEQISLTRQEWFALWEAAGGEIP